MRVTIPLGLSCLSYPHKFFPSLKLTDGHSRSVSFSCCILLMFVLLIIIAMILLHHTHTRTYITLLHLYLLIVRWGPPMKPFV